LYSSGKKSPLSTFTGTVNSVRSAFSKKPSGGSGGFYLQNKAQEPRNRATQASQDNYFKDNGGEEADDPKAFVHPRRKTTAAADYEESQEYTMDEAAAERKSKQTSQASNSAASGKR
jgi:hypothetical protein